MPPPALPLRQKSPVSELSPPPRHDQPITTTRPLLRLEIQDLRDTGARRFLDAVDAAGLLEDAVHTVLEQLYPGQYRGSWPGTRSVTLILHSFQGVAYTRGKSLDDDHKEIHLSTQYIASVKADLLKSEIRGVIVHEMVHCFQWNGCDTAPGGLIEGVADWVRLRAGLSPPHWKKADGGNRWDAGYQVTAWFLDWLEDRYGPRVVPRINHVLRDTTYEEKKYWYIRCGLHETVQDLWNDYKKSLANKKNGEKEEHEKKDDQEDDGQFKSAGGAAESDRNKDCEKSHSDEVQKGNKDNNDREETSGEPKKNEDAKSDDEDGGWTDLSSGVVELK